MKAYRIMLFHMVVAVTVLAVVSPAMATSYDELSTLIDSAKIKEAHIFAPDVWKKVERKFEDAGKSIQYGKNQKTIDKIVSEAREYCENALKATEVGKLSLQEYLEPREKANAASAPMLVPELYMQAEEQFMKATEKVEKGDVKNGLKEAEKSKPMFNLAELEAIREDILGPANTLIEKSLADDAAKFALSTLDKARAARDKANAIITADRYNRADATVEASRAEYEAKHASNIAQSVRSLNRNDQAWEKLMLIYEIQMNRVGGAIGLDHLPFDNGPMAAADTLINYVKAMQSNKAATSGEFATMTDQLKKSLSKLGGQSTEQDPIALAGLVDQKISDLLVEMGGLSEQVQVSQNKLSALSAEHAEVTEELSDRLEREEKFKKAKQMLNPSEGEVLFNSSNDIVLRLGGLSFDIGSSKLKDEHIPLLQKVQKVIQMFPASEIMVEGHTDASGEASSNVTLSEKRAYEVMQYLRQAMLIPANQIQSIGYGADKPIASNQTKEGRAKNRRIDVILMQ